MFVLVVKERNDEQQHAERYENNGFRNGTEVGNIVNKKFDECNAKQHHCPNTQVFLVFGQTQPNQEKGVGTPKDAQSQLITAIQTGKF